MDELQDEAHRRDRPPVPRGAVTQLPTWMWLLATVIAVGLAVWCATQESWAGLIVSAAVALMCGYAWRARARGSSAS
jgi:4-hydroxybenzoate polyprenyltransferase